MKKVATKASALIVFAFSPEGRKDIGSAIALVTAVYVGLHRAGVL